MMRSQRGRGNRGRGRGRGTHAQRTPKRPRIQPQPEPVPMRQEPPPPPAPPADANYHLKFTYGVNAWRHWVVFKNTQVGRFLLFVSVSVCYSLILPNLNNVQCLGWRKLCFSPWTEWIKIESVPLFKCLSPCDKSRLIQVYSIIPSIDWSTQILFSPFQTFISKKNLKTDLQPNP